MLQRPQVVVWIFINLSYITSFFRELGVLYNHLFIHSFPSCPKDEKGRSERWCALSKRKKMKQKTHNFHQVRDRNGTQCVSRILKTLPPKTASHLGDAQERLVESFEWNRERRGPRAITTDGENSVGPKQRTKLSAPKVPA